MSFVPVRPIAALMLIAAPVVTAQQAVFRAAVDLVTVDVTVPGRDGRPVDDLDLDDFQLSIDGQPRRIVSAQFVSHDPARLPTMSLAARHFTSNEHADAGRFVVMAVDEAHIRRLEGRSAVQAAADFVDRLNPMDRVAVASLGRDGAMAFTRDRAEVRRRLTALRGQTDPVFLQFNIGLTEAFEIADGGRARLAEVVLRECGRSLAEYTNPARAADDTLGGRDGCPEQVEQEARVQSQHARTQARISLSALQALVAGLKVVEGPKTIVLLSEGMVLDPRLVDVAELAATANDARVSIYALQMEIPTFEASQDRVSPTFLRDQQLGGDGLARLAGATRGAVFRLVGSDPQPFERIAAELSGYYLLAFEAADRDRDGRVHRLDVRLARGGGALRARPAFRLPPVVPSSHSREQELVDLLRGSHAGKELPVRVATFAYPETAPGKQRVVVSAEAGRPDDPAGDVLLGYVLTDSAGVIAASGAERTLAGRHAFSTVVPAGAYTLRVAGIDPLGRRGRVERPFAVTANETRVLAVSDLILAPVPPTPKQPLQPYVDRVAASRAVAYLEVRAKNDDLLRETYVVFEVASEAGGAPRLTTRADVTRVDASLGIARVELSLADLAPGRYTARGRVMTAGDQQSEAARPFTYDPRP